MAPTTLWSRYSMLRAVIEMKQNVDISKYKELRALLKKKTKGHRPKKAKVFTSTNISKFLNDAPDDQYLAMKVVTIMSVCGGCRCNELTNMKRSDVEIQDEVILIKVPKTKTGIQQSFVINKAHAATVKTYMALRLESATTDRFFLRFDKGKCSVQPIGINKCSGMPKQIATYLQLENAELYSGHSFRRTSATLLVEGGGDLGEQKRHGGWKSTTIAEGYVENSFRGKIATCNKITSDLKPNKPARSILGPVNVPALSAKPYIVENLSENIIEIPNTSAKITVQISNCSNCKIEIGKQ
ncbi:uncharacterized protein LOC112457651 [Temnothorax curvispinosus]|uniref:Uncharacterized protein LOC112457651 n=1 Tax=Temnothorax curvispinosus TaxID=300111 RepID=A0A6J1Q4J9_9HYME|nr:uncharacterized protein LOC112457651 [Temnothorax curvispinosus]